MVPRPPSNHLPPAPSAFLVSIDPNLNRRILVIDDNPAIHGDFRKILVPQKRPDKLIEFEAELFDEKAPPVVIPEFEIDSAFQGQEGFNLIEKSLAENRPYAMAFVDVRMPPGWDGVETTAQIWRRYPDLQVVICTAYSDYSWEDVLRKLGYSDRLVILKKPFENIEVLQLAISMTEKWRLYYQARLRLEDLEAMVHDRTTQLVQTNSELSTANEMLKIATDKAQDMAKTALLSSEAKSEFLANMSHEIRTPMNGVIGMVNLLLDTRLTSEQKEFAHTIKFSADSLLSIINDILDFSKIEAGKMHFEKIDFDLQEVVAKSIEFFRPRAKEKQIELHSSLPANVPTHLTGDPARLRQVLLNLLGNALKFTEKGGVRLEVNLLADKNGQVVLRFSVVDTGIGIPEATLGKLFQSFTQADASTTRKYGGTGLGLAICRRIVDLMGGTIDARSVVGEGSTFAFTLPFARRASATIPPARLPTASELVPQSINILHGLPVLLAEDDRVNQLVGCKLLQKLGCAVSVVNNGLEAVEAWSRHRFRIILMDCQMPELDGFDACRQIRAKESAEGLPHTWIIAMTASAMPSDRERCLAVGMDGYISKPVVDDELVAGLVKAAEGLSVTSPSSEAR